MFSTLVLSKYSFASFVSVSSILVPRFDANKLVSSVSEIEKWFSPSDSHNQTLFSPAFLVITLVFSATINAE